MRKFTIILSYVMTVLLTACVTLGVVFTQVLPNLTTDFPGGDHMGASDYSKLSELEGLIDKYFIGEVPESSELEDAMAEAMVGALGDRWSHYISAADMAAYNAQMDNSYVGVGMTVSVREDGTGVDIKQVTEGGPAEAQGILAGDILVAVDGTDVRGMDLTTVRNMVIGEEGTTVKLTMVRGEQTLDFTVPRQQFETPVTAEELLPGNIGLVTIFNFNSRCAQESIASIERLREQGATALILDVRNNPGGYQHELVKLLDYLLPEGKLFISEDYTGKTSTDYSDDKFLDMPMVVMVNEESYSAAEFFAAAMREYDAAKVVGNKTCGKGYYQVTMNLKDGSAVGLSIGKYFTPNGVSLAGVGITPDVVVEVEDELFWEIYYGNVAPENDPQIQAAVALLTGE